MWGRREHSLEDALGGARPRDFASPGVSTRLPASRPASLAASLSLGLLTSGASDIALARNLASSSLAEAQAAVPHGPHQARLPHRRRLNPRPNAPFLPPFGAVATEFSFISGFYLILYFFSSPLSCGDRSSQGVDTLLATLLPIIASILEVVEICDRVDCTGRCGETDRQTDRPTVVLVV